ncbi:hypothetical protein HHI36_011726 [Cryptolaemus montrouzieri]|uniref:Peptidase S1 domain-containing protein n=1 Tax=Cryptolaemus montrouzieri TaxID=559131 RepID=A0ABD2NCQ1_9CUCU
MTYNMIFHLIFCLFVVSVVGVNENNTKASYKCMSKDFPFLVLLKGTSPSIYCGGALINSETVVTAAHCIENFIKTPEKLQIIFNVSEENAEGTQKSIAANIFRHKKFDRNHFTYNIAIIIMQEPITQGEPIKLPTEKENERITPSCEKLLTMTWPYESKINAEGNSVKITLNPQLYCLELPLITKEECSLLGGENLDTFFCTFSEHDAYDHNCGDYSGYPVFCKDTLYGIVSNAYSCGIADVPNFHTKVEYVIDFWHETMAKVKMGRSINIKSTAFSLNYRFQINILHFLLLIFLEFY